MRPPIILFVATATSRALTAEQAMSGQLPFCMPNTSLAQAAKMMAENRVHELPVIVDQRCLGYVSYSDILQRYVQPPPQPQPIDITRPPPPHARPPPPLDS